MKTVLSMLLVSSFLALPTWAAHHEGSDDGKHCYKGKARYEEALGKLPEDKAAMVRDTMDKAKQAQEPQREAARKLHEELLAISEAETFDRDAFLAKRKQLREIRNEMGAAWDQTLADISGKLTAEERRTLASAAKWRHGSHHDEKKAAPAAQPAAE